MSLKLLLFLLLLTQAFAQVHVPDFVKLTEVKISSCNKTHGMLRLLKAQNVLIHDAPQKTDIGHCQLEWTRYGTCCEQASLKAYAEEDRRAIKASVNTLESKLASMAKSFSELIDASKRIVSKKIKLEPVAEVLISTIVNEETEKLKEFITGYFAKKDEEQTPHKSMSGCWEEMARIRSNSLCGVCSGRSEVFFSEHDKARFLAMDCQPMIDSCLSSFDDFVKFVEGVDKFADKFNKSMALWGDSNKDYLVGVVRNLDLVTEAIKSNPLHQRMKEFVDTKDLDNESQKWNLCESFITVRKEPYIVALKDLFIKYELNPINQLNVLFNQTIQKQIQKWKHSRHCDCYRKRRCHRCTRRSSWRSHSCSHRHDRHDGHDCHHHHGCHHRHTCSHRHDNHHEHTCPDAAPDRIQKYARETSCSWQIQNRRSRVCQRRRLSLLPANPSAEAPWKPARTSSLNTQPIDASIVFPLNSFVPSVNVTEISNFNGDVQVVPDFMAKIDSSYSSVFGTVGTTGNEASASLPSIPLNLTMAFP